MDSAHAGLGEPESRLQADAMQMAARRHLQVRPSYTVHRFEMPDGSQMQEYVSQAGLVFAVRWHTAYKPKLAVLLGGAYPEFIAASRSAAAATGVRRQFLHRGADLVIRSHGHLHLFTGIAYRPSLLPAGITAAQIE
ncbi:MAG: DUF2844 domain-containing protein [Rhodoferax sp.]